MAKDNKNTEALRGEASEYEDVKISLPESIIVVLLAASADAFEIVAALIAAVPVVGLVVWLMAFSFGIFVSVIIIIWSLLKGARGSFVVKYATRRLIALIGGAILDALTGGILPMRTIVLIITIWLNNHFADKDLERVLSLLKKV